jgi:hypothetical protein
VSLSRSSPSPSAMRALVAGTGSAIPTAIMISPPLELASLPPQRLAKLRVVGEFEEEGVACAGARSDRPGLQFGHSAQALDQLVDSRDRRHRGRLEVRALALGIQSTIPPTNGSWTIGRFTN